MVSNSAKPVPYSIWLPFSTTSIKSLEDYHKGNSVKTKGFKKFSKDNGRNLAKDVIKACIRCHRFNSTPHQVIMADLPWERIFPGIPFTHSRLDFAGPIKTKPKEKTCCNFCMLLYQTIHIETVPDLTITACIAALKRFTNRRETRERLFTDNGTNFFVTS